MSNSHGNSLSERPTDPPILTGDLKMKDFLNSALIVFGQRSLRSRWPQRKPLASVVTLKENSL